MIKPILRVGIVFDYQYFKVFQHVYKEKQGKELNIRLFTKFLGGIAATKDEIFRITHMRSYSGLYSGELTPFQYQDHYKRLSEFATAGIQIHYFTTTGKEKEVDNALTVDTLKNANDFDVVVIFSGDRDMIPLVRELQRQGKSVSVPTCRISYGKDKVFTSSLDLVDVADRAIMLDRFVEPVSRSY